MATDDSTIAEQTWKFATSIKCKALQAIGLLKLFQEYSDCTIPPPSTDIMLFTVLSQLFKLHAPETGASNSIYNISNCHVCLWVRLIVFISLSTIA